MKDEFAKMQKILGVAIMALVLASLFVNPLRMLTALGTHSFSDLDIQLGVPVLFARMAFIVAVTCFLVGRQVSRMAIVCSAPCDDLTVLLSMVRAMLTEYGYRELDTVSPYRWASGAERFVKGQPFRPLWMPDHRVSIEAAGPARLRVEGSSALLRQLRKRIAGTAAVPYTGPQPWISRYKSLPWIAPCVLVIAACIWSMLPVIEGRVNARHHHAPPPVAKCAPDERSDSQAVSWYRKAAETGDALGMANLGFMYSSGRGGLPKDDSQAVSWYPQGGRGRRCLRPSGTKAIGCQLIAGP
jgi:hypothetical protein